MLSARTSDVELQSFAIHLDVTCALLDRFEIGYAGGELRLEILPLQGKSFCFGLDLSDLLLAILKDEQLLQFRLHARMLWAAHTAVNYCRAMGKSAAPREVMS